MASPQREDGYTAIANEIMEKMARTRLSPMQYRLLFVIWRYTYGYQRKEAELSLSFLADSTGCDKRQIQRELKDMESRRIINQNIADGQARVIGFNKDYDQWLDSQPTRKGIGEFTNGEVTNGEMTNGETVNRSIGEMTNTPIGEMTNQKRNILNKTLKKNNIPFCEIVGYLNQVCKTNFKPSTKTTRQHISARWNEGFRLDDFRRVIDIKAAEWLSDPQMAQYLRPVTLFGTKFESYLNQKLVRSNEQYAGHNQRDNPRSYELPDDFYWSDDDDGRAGPPIRGPDLPQ